MTERKYFGTDGIRGKVGEFPITPDFVMKLGWAAGKVLATQGVGRILVGKDTRISGYMLESALEAGLSSAGISSVFTGPMPTPAIAYLTRACRFSAGIIISASHNPFYDNGIKFFSAQGKKLPDDVELAIEQEMESPFICVDSANLGRVSRIKDAAGRYIEFCKNSFPSEFSLNGIKIVVDCAHGATYYVGPQVFEELGGIVQTIGCEPNGLNINEKCGATDVKQLQAKVVAEKADLGIAFDGDGDRVMMVDHLGNIIDGDQIIYILAQEAVRSGQMSGGVVGTLMSNMGLELALQNISVPFCRAKVGDRYVLEKLEELNWRMGAENSGHVILLDRNTTGDGIVAALQVLSVMIRTGHTLHELCEPIQLLPQILINVSYKGENSPLENQAVQKLAEETEKQLKNRGRVLLRKSGTEALIRVMVEGESRKETTEHAEKIAEAIRALC